MMTMVNNNNTSYYTPPKRLIIITVSSALAVLGDGFAITKQVGTHLFDSHRQTFTGGVYSAEISRRPGQNRQRFMGDSHARGHRINSCSCDPSAQIICREINIT